MWMAIAINKTMMKWFEKSTGKRDMASGGEMAFCICGNNVQICKKIKLSKVQIKFSDILEKLQTHSA